MSKTTIMIRKIINIERDGTNAFDNVSITPIKIAPINEPFHEPRPPTTTTINDITKISESIPEYSPKRGAPIPPLNPAIPTPNAKTPVNTKLTFIPSAESISRSSTPALIIAPIREYRSTYHSMSATRIPTPTINNRYAGKLSPSLKGMAKLNKSGEDNALDSLPHNH